MNTDDRDTPQYEPEPTSYDALPRKIDPPPALERRIVNALHDRDLLGPPVAPWWTRPRIGMAIAAAILLMMIGYQIGRWDQPAPSTGNFKFTLFLYTYVDAPPLELPENYLDAYSDWSSKVSEQSNELSGEGLLEGGAVLLIKEKELLILELEEFNWDIQMQAYYEFEANSYEEAMEFAKTNPHLEFGGLMVLRQREW